MCTLKSGHVPSICTMCPLLIEARKPKSLLPSPFFFTVVIYGCTQLANSKQIRIYVLNQIALLRVQMRNKLKPLRKHYNSKANGIIILYFSLLNSVVLAKRKRIFINIYALNEHWLMRTWFIISDAYSHNKFYVEFTSLRIFNFCIAYVLYLIYAATVTWTDWRI